MTIDTDTPQPRDQRTVMPRRNLSNDTATYKKIGRLIATKREKLGKTEEQVAKGIYMSVDKYQRMEKGSALLDLHTLCAIAAYFKCGLNELVPGKTEPKKKDA